MLKRVSGQSAQLHPECRVAVSLSATMPMRMGELEVWTEAILSSPEKRSRKAWPHVSAPCVRSQRSASIIDGRRLRLSAKLIHPHERDFHADSLQSPATPSHVAGKVYNPEDRHFRSDHVRLPDMQSIAQASSRTGNAASSTLGSRYETEAATLPAAPIGGKA
jgi:hypothetical protein